jgi:hypothetical protein
MPGCSAQRGSHATSCRLDGPVEHAQVIGVGTTASRGEDGLVAQHARVVQGCQDEMVEDLRAALSHADADHPILVELKRRKD